MTYARQCASSLGIAIACLFFSSPASAQTLGLRSTFQVDTEETCCLAFSPDGKTLASAGRDRNDPSIRHWDLASGKARTFEKSVSSLTDVDGKLAATVPAAVEPWKSAAAPGTIVDKRAICVDPIVEFRSDGKVLAWGGVFDPEIKVWDLATKKNVASFAIDTVAAMTFVPGNKTLASVRFDRPGIDLWDIAAGKKSATLAKDKFVVQAAFSPNGKTIAIANADSPIVSLLEISSGSEQASLKGHTAKVGCVTFSPDGKTLASGSADGKIVLWDVEKSRDVATIDAHRDAIHALAFAADGKTLASGSKDKTIKLWNVAPN
jgi:WD40 repeat protein